MQDLTGFSQWWGDFDIFPHSILLWKMGPLSLWVQRLEKELRLAYEINSSDPTDQVLAGVKLEEFDLLQKEHVFRFGFSRELQNVTLLPVLADRPVVAKPEKPFYILPRDKVKIFVSTPIWIRVLTDSNKLMSEVPVLKLSDTWFGNNTLEGELCYASQTFCRLRLQDIVFYPYRAVTQVTIENQADSALFLDSLNLPVNYLSIYAQQETHVLWTESIRLVRAEGEKLNPIKINLAPSEKIGPCLKIQGPRVKPQKNLLTRAFKNFF